MVDLAGVVDVVLDEDGDDAAGLLGATVVDLALLHQIIVVERGDALAEAVVALAEPGGREGARGRPFLGLGHAARPEERGVAEGLVVVDVLGGAGVGDEVADGAGAAGWRPEPVVVMDGREVAEERVLLVAFEGVVEEVEERFNDEFGHIVAFCTPPTRPVTYWGTPVLSQEVGNTPCAARYASRRWSGVCPPNAVCPRS